MILPDQPEPPPGNPRPIVPPGTSGSSWPWWFVLIFLVSLIFALNFLEKAAPATPTDPAKAASPILRIYGRYMLGVKGVFGRSTPAEAADMLAAIEGPSPPLHERIRMIPLAGELVGPDAAIERLAAIEAELDADPSIDSGYRRDAESLRAIYESDEPAATLLEQSQRDSLVDRHGWFAQLALTRGLPDSDPARAPFFAEGKRVMAVLLTFFFVMVVTLLVGFALFIIAVVLRASGSLRAAFPGSIGPPRLPASNALLESVVLFLVAFLGASIVGEVVRGMTGINVTFALAWIIGVLALWPLTRGVPFDRLRGSLGWHAGRGVFREMGAGIVGHLAGIPIILLGLLVSILIIAATKADASHPIANDINTGSPLAVAGLFLMTSVWAPLVEETFFRGALYAHLRGALSARLVGHTDEAAGLLLRRGMSALPAALITGFIFAAIHPQGFGGVPVLTALGLNFCLMREWRGSLIAPITAHALHNGAITLLLVFLLS